MYTKIDPLVSELGYMIKHLVKVRIHSHSKENSIIIDTLFLFISEILIRIGKFIYNQPKPKNIDS
jgi:hypothetical protein